MDVLLGALHFLLGIVHCMQPTRASPLASAGSYGKVYRGLWRGNSVAVKVRPHTAAVPFGSLEAGQPVSPSHLQMHCVMCS